MREADLAAELQAHPRLLVRRAQRSNGGKGTAAVRSAGFEEKIVNGETVVRTAGVEIAPAEIDRLAGFY